MKSVNAPAEMPLARIITAEDICKKLIRKLKGIDNAMKPERRLFIRVLGGLMLLRQLEPEKGDLIPEVGDWATLQKRPMTVPTGATTDRSPLPRKIDNKSSRSRDLNNRGN